MPRAWPVLLLVACAVISASVYQGALRGAFISDDYGYIVTSPHTNSLTIENVFDILDPRGQAMRYTVNYAPVHLLLTALERQIFADEVLGYHLVNVFVHALVCALLVALFRASGVPDLAALCGGLLFALHPANVEAVAWISQLKTTASLALTLAALLALRRRPALATLFFALGLLTKASAWAALPTAAALTWARQGRAVEKRDALPGKWAWVGLWALLFGLYAVVEFSAIGYGSVFHEPAYDDVLVHIRSIAAVGTRYLVMAVSSLGVSAFQSPTPVISGWDPWWLAALPLAVALLWRTIATLRGRREEAAYWVFAIASFGPVSQIFPFVNPVADRYLYFILPGLIGGLLLLGLDLPGRSDASLGSTEAGLASWLPTSSLGRGALLCALVLSLIFGVRSYQRAGLWDNETRLLLDAVKNYPEGGPAVFFRARDAAQMGDVATALELLREAEAKHTARFFILLTDPGLAPIRGHADFQALVREMAGRWIEHKRKTGVSTQSDHRVVGLAHQVRKEYALAADAFERALEAGGTLDELIRSELELVRDKQSRGFDGGKGR